MTLEVFETQWQRLVARFGSKAMDQEFQKLCLREVRDMRDGDFIRFCDVHIGHRKHTDPPRLAEFREARVALEKAAFQQTVRGALNAFETRSMPEILARHGYTGCKTLMEAVEVQKLRNQIARENGGGEV